MSIDDQQEAASLGAFVEQMAAAIKAVGAGSCIPSSYMGAAPLGIPADGYAAFVQGSSSSAQPTPSWTRWPGRSAALLGL